MKDKLKIVAALNAHNNPDIVLDTLDSIYHFMTKDVFVVIDEAGWEQFESIKYKDVKFEKGYYHNYYRCPYKNVAFSLRRMYEYDKDADWYCYIEYDCLITSDLFKADLLTHKKRGSWLLANDIRYATHCLPNLVDKIIGKPVGPVITMLGCCVFYSNDYLKALYHNFLVKFLTAVRGFDPGFFPDFGGYALEEELFPTLARFYGGKVEELAGWDGYKWRGNSHRFLMRHPHHIVSSDISPAVAIIHPLKSFDEPIRNHFRKIRKSRFQ